MATKEYVFALREHKIEYGRKLRVTDLRIEPQAQRVLSFSESRCQKMADNFIPGAVGTIVVSRRQDGALYVCDGIHRKRVLELLDVETVMAEVHHGLSVTEEAMLFLIKNKESAQVRPLDMYKVGVTARIKQYVDTEAILEQFDLTVGNSSAHQIGAINGLVKITEDFGVEVLARTLDVLDMAFGRTPETWDGNLLGGMGRFVNYHGHQLDDARFAKKLAKGGPAYKYKGEVVARASQGGAGRILTAYTVFKDRYNQGRSEATKIL